MTFVVISVPKERCYVFPFTYSTILLKITVKYYEFTSSFLECSRLRCRSMYLKKNNWTIDELEVQNR